MNTNKESTQFLNSLLSNEYALFTKTLNYHWNVTGPRFHSLHTFMEGHYKKLLEIMDDVAERVRVLDGTPLSTVKEMENSMSMDEKNGKDMSSNQMIQDLYDGHTQIQSLIKEAVIEKDVFSKDPGSEDFLIGVLQEHEMMSWMLKSHLD